MPAKERFGELYRAAICGFADGIKAAANYGTERMVLFVDPAVFFEYGLQNADCGVSDDYVWVRYRSTDGDVFAKTLSRDQEEALCGKPPHLPFRASVDA